MASCVVVIKMYNFYLKHFSVWWIWFGMVWYW